MLSLKQELPVRYDDKLGWIVDWNEALPSILLYRLRERVRVQWQQRMLGMPQGPVKDRIRDALVALKRDGIRQRVSGGKMIDLFKSTRRVNPDRSFSFSGGRHG